MQGKSGEKKNQYEGVVGGGTNKNRTKLGGGRRRVKTDEKNQRNWEVGERIKKPREGGRRTKINRTRLPTAPLGVEIVCENNMGRRLSERIPLKRHSEQIPLKLVEMDTIDDIHK